MRDASRLLKLPKLLEWHCERSADRHWNGVCVGGGGGGHNERVDV
jgi:hypothetical protein